MLPARTSVREVGATMICASAHSAKPHIIGWRVTRNTPEGSRVARSPTGIPGRAGLRANEPRNSTVATIVGALAIVQLTSSCPLHTGSPNSGAARKASTIHANVARLTKL